MTSIDYWNESPLPLLTDSRFELHAVGRWSGGGLLEIRFSNKAIDTIELSTVEWSVLALLMKAGLQSAEGHWAVAFMNAKQLAGELRRRAHRGSGSPADIHRAIHRVRKLLDRSFAAELQPSAEPSKESWGKRLIEQHAKFGYRISLQPRQLHLTELEDDASPDTASK